MEERFWSKVNKTESCWLWTGCITKAGYGQLSLNCKTHYSHQVAWLLFGNTIPEGHLIRHKCRNRNCCNPEHLETGTHQQNSNDMKRDGTSCANINRDVKGEKHHKAKLTEKDILDIRASDIGTMRLAEKYNVGYTHICHIRARKIWKHI